MRKLAATDLLAQLSRDERGQTMAEYGVVLALVTLAVVGAMTMLSGNISGAFTSIAGILP
ncbi:MAG: Flp family type IVb pilin [Gaiellaceae bacterium]